jgi:hypothetical protein
MIKQLGIRDIFYIKCNLITIFISSAEWKINNII